jgi:hypothetical protein
MLGREERADLCGGAGYGLQRPGVAQTETALSKYDSLDLDSNLLGNKGCKYLAMCTWEELEILGLCISRSMLRF